MPDPTVQIRELAKRLAGIDLGEGKRAMVEGRLGKRLRELGIDLGAYVKRVERDQEEQGIMLDLLTTNHTAWMRESSHFDDFATRILAKLDAGREPRRALRIWCAAAATGEEPYTIAMTVARTLPDFATRDIAILATDISQRALARARAAEYSAERVSGLGESERMIALEAIDPREHGAARRYRVRPELRAMVHFARLNLMESWPMRGPFDAIFCRNVMIYFDRPTQERLVNRMAGLLRPGGILYVGHSESLNALHQPLRPVGTAIYAA